MILRSEEWKITRRVAGRSDYRLDGLSDLLVRASGMSVLDIGCSRGAVGMDFAKHGARAVHGCDRDEDAIFVARSNFADLRAVESRFEVVDLLKGPKSLNWLDPTQYDIVLLLATYHKIKREMKADALSALMRDLGRRTFRYFAWRGTSEKHNENEGELLALDKDLQTQGLKRVHTSYISYELGVAAIWARV